MSSNKINRHSSNHRFTCCHLSDQINCTQWKVHKAMINKFLHYQRSLKVLNLVRIVIISTVVTLNSCFKTTCRSNLQTTTSCLKLRIHSKSDLQFQAHTLRCFQTLTWFMLSRPTRSGSIKFQNNQKHEIKPSKFPVAANLIWDQRCLW